MSREWAIFYKTSGATSPILDPFTSNLPLEGMRSSSQAVSFGYPSFMTADQIEEWFYRFRAFTFTLAYHLTGTDPGTGYDWDITCTQSGAVVSDQSAGDAESSLYTIWATSATQEDGAQGGFTVTASGTQIATIDGVTTTQPLMSVGGELRISGTRAVFANTATDPYFYRTDTKLWLPRQDLGAVESGSSFFNAEFSTAERLTPGGGEVEELLAGAATINGVVCDVSTLRRSFLAWDTFAITVTPVEWWEYRDRNGANPIWNSVNGAKLLPNTLPMGS